MGSAPTDPTSPRALVWVRIVGEIASEMLEKNRSHQDLVEEQLFRLETWAHSVPRRRGVFLGLANAAEMSDPSLTVDFSSAAESSSNPFDVREEDVPCGLTRDQLEAVGLTPLTLMAAIERAKRETERKRSSHPPPPRAWNPEKLDLGDPWFDGP